MEFMFFGVVIGMIIVGSVAMSYFATRTVANYASEPTVTLTPAPAVAGIGDKVRFTTRSGHKLVAKVVAVSMDGYAIRRHQRGPVFHRRNVLV